MATTKVEASAGTSHWIICDGFRLHVWEKRMKGSNGAKVTLLVHGGTYCGPADFDVQAPGKEYSLMDYLAARGRDAFTFDHRGYGRSDRPEDGFSVTPEAKVRDIEAVVEHICRLRHASSVDLFGWSAGGVTTAIYASRHPQRVKRLVMYAGGAGGRPSGTIPIPTESWLVNTRENVMERIDQSLVIPEAQEAFIQAILRWDPKSPMGGRRALAAGASTLWPVPEEVTVPTLIIYGAQDPGYQPQAVADFFARLQTDDKALMVVPNADHFLIIDKCYLRLFTATEQWFNEATL